MAWDGFSLRRKKEMPDGLFMKCNGCGKTVYRKTVAEGLNVCPECNFHFTITSSERISLLLDDGKLEEMDVEMRSADPLKFKATKTYADQLAKYQEGTGLRDAVVTGTGRIGGHEIVFAVTDSRFLMGSMASVVGEKVTRAVELATDTGRPIVIVSGSGGGARMHEGVLSLSQMAKTSAAIARLHDAGGLFISVLTNPTMGGVAASFASLGDIIIAEPKALIGFAGPRTIWHTLKIELPEGFQTSEFFIEHGFLDMIANRSDLKNEIIKVLDYIVGDDVIEKPETEAKSTNSTKNGGQVTKPSRNSKTAQTKNSNGTKLKVGKS